MSYYSESFLSDYKGEDDQNEGQNYQKNTEVFRGIRQTLEETSRNLSHEQQQHVQTKQELQEEREKRQQLELMLQEADQQICHLEQQLSRMVDNQIARQPQPNRTYNDSASHFERIDKFTVENVYVGKDVFPDNKDREKKKE